MKAKAKGKEHIRQKAVDERQTPEFPWATPPEELWNGVHQVMGIGTPARASEDGQRFILKRRLPLLQSADHFRYIELESAG
jgi:hypothetical protein